MLPDTTLDQSIPVIGVAHMDVLAIDDHVWVVTDIETRGHSKIVLSVTRADGAAEREFTFTPEDTVVRYAAEAFIHLARTAAAGVPRIAALEARIAADAARNEAEMARLVADAHEYANDARLCENFDDFMESHGLPRRAAEYQVEVEISQRIFVTVSATSEYDAEQMVENMGEDLLEKVREDIEINGFDQASYSAERCD